MNFVMKHAPGAGSIAQPVDQLSSELPQMPRIWMSLNHELSVGIRMNEMNGALGQNSAL